MEAEKLAYVIRGETIESVHRGHLIVLDGDGKTVAQAGDPSTVTFFRSACKPFQAMPLITSGAADAFEFTGDEIALAAASHSGERIHVETAARMLLRIGLSENDLRCGIHLPFNEKETHRILRANEKPTQLHNNCSGKHAAMLAVAKHLNADLASYEDLDHPVQKAILSAVAEFTELPSDEIALAIDGCAAPNFGVPVSAMARSFLNLVSPPKHFNEASRSAADCIVSAMTKFPELIGGTSRLDTMLMQAAEGRIISKVGADGVWLCGVLPCKKYPAGLGIALKIEDGNDDRARPVVAVEVLRQLDILSSQDLRELSPMPIKNRRSDLVGRVEASTLVLQMDN